MCNWTNRNCRTVTMEGREKEKEKKQERKKKINIHHI